MAAAIVIALRLVLPLTILRWPLAGGLLAMLIDALDVVLVDALAKALGEAPEFRAIQEWILHWEQLHPWQWLRETIIRPILGGP